MLNYIFVMVRCSVTQIIHVLSYTGYGFKCYVLIYTGYGSDEQKASQALNCTGFGFGEQKGSQVLSSRCGHCDSFVHDNASQVLVKTLLSSPDCKVKHILVRDLLSSPD
jgi:hypothetical protein